jgi:multicomponent Na+:H+ antiporter subunit A
MSHIHEKKFRSLKTSVWKNVMIVIALVLSVILLSFLIPLLPPINKHLPQWATFVVSAVTFIIFFSFIPQIMNGSTIIRSIQWVPALKLTLSLRLDGLSLLFSIIISGIGWIIFLYSGEYMHGKSDTPLFYGLLVFFMGSMLGLVLAENLILLYLFWELTSISSFFLIGFEHEKKEARDAAWQALIVTAAGGLCLLAAIIITGVSSGSFELSDILKSRLHENTSKLILFLFLISILTKSAQFPFHFWLPDAMTAPTPVSAYLHSATMVNAGIYIAARFFPLFSQIDEWNISLMITGAITAIITGYLALKQHDSKRILAYSTCSVLGLILFMFGQGTDAAVKGALIYIFTHALYKATLFMTGGIIDHQVGTRNVQIISGLGRFMPFTAVAAAMAAISKSGMPPSLGFISKEYMYKSSINVQSHFILLTSIVITISAALASVAFITGIRPYIGKPEYPSGKPEEAGWKMVTAPMISSSLGIVFALYPSLIENTLLIPALSVIKQQSMSLDLALWHGLHPSVYTGLTGLIFGFLLFLFRNKVEKIITFIDIGYRFGPSRIYKTVIHSFIVFSNFLTQLLQSGDLPLYLSIIYSTIIITIVTFSGHLIFSFIKFPSLSPELYYEPMLALVITTTAFITITIRSRLGSVVALGVVGFGVALLFLNFGAPDVAVTQILVDTLTVFILVLASNRLPQFRSISGFWANIRDICIALASGVLTTVLILTALKVQLKETVSKTLLSNNGIHTRDIVTKILSDVRAFDTLGESIVLLLAGIGVFTLLKQKQ